MLRGMIILISFRIRSTWIYSLALTKWKIGSFYMWLHYSRPVAFSKPITRWSALCLLVCDLCVHMCTCMHACTLTCACVITHTYMNVCTHIYISVYIESMITHTVCNMTAVPFVIEKWTAKSASFRVTGHTEGSYSPDRHARRSRGIWIGIQVLLWGCCGSNSQLHRITAMCRRVSWNDWGFGGRQPHIEDRGLLKFCGASFMERLYHSVTNLWEFMSMGWEFANCEEVYRIDRMEGVYRSKRD